MSLAESGYAIAEHVLSNDVCDDVTAMLLHAGHSRSRAGIRHLMKLSTVAELAADHRLLALAQQALGATAIPYRATLFEKSGDSNWLVPWHQDTALPLTERFEADGWSAWSEKAGILYAQAPAAALAHVVALRVHLDASASGNGPLRVIPGSHIMGVLSDADVYKHARTRVHAECLISRGGVLAMRPLLIHSSPKAHTAEPRRVLHIEYADSLHILPGITLAIA